MKESLFQDLIVSIKEARELNLIIEEIYCNICDRILPNKKFITLNGCLWCDPKGDKDAIAKKKI